MPPPHIFSRKHIAAAVAGLAALLVNFLADGRALAAPPALDVPVACKLGRDCFIQFYVDRDAGTGIADYHCGALTYDGHKGTDFRLVDLPAMRRGVVVRAAAAGTVRAIRDGEPDIGTDESTRDLAGREAGNAVVLMHDAGWETQYSHLMHGSITVQKGQRVEAGAALGLIGFSGNSSFPHLDFSVRRDGNIVDPFGRGPSPACAASGERLWTAAAEKQLAYLPGAVLVTGFAAQIPERRAVRGGMHRARELSTLAPMLVFWVDMFGLAAGDIAFASSRRMERLSRNANSGWTKPRTSTSIRSAGCGPTRGNGRAGPTAANICCSAPSTANAGRFSPRCAKSRCVEALKT